MSGPPKYVFAVPPPVTYTAGKPACSINFAVKQSVAPGTIPGPPAAMSSLSFAVRGFIASLSRGETNPIKHGVLANKNYLAYLRLSAAMSGKNQATSPRIGKKEHN